MEKTISSGAAIPASGCFDISGCSTVRPKTDPIIKGAYTLTPGYPAGRHRNLFVPEEQMGLDAAPGGAALGYSLMQ
jgi:hypothetical protein